MRAVTLAWASMALGNRGLITQQNLVQVSVNSWTQNVA